jgi:gamma-glutamyltranspeptidase/glutathione hydrolase
MFGGRVPPFSSRCGALKGAVATGHPLTTAAAEAVLRDGGNAFDAIIAAHFMACVAEPVLTSLGSGGYLLAEPAQGRSRVYDFFAQTPRNKHDHDLDFYPISADFGPATQEFHIGLASVATPGTVKGMFAVHRDLGTVPMRQLLQPAVQAARQGVPLNRLQAYILEVVSPIYLASAEAGALFGSATHPGKTLQEGELLQQPELAATLEALAEEGEALFYLGDIAAAIAGQCRQRGLLTREDLAHYQVELREPLRVRYRDAELLVNPPPSSGGVLIAFALAMLDGMPAHRHGSIEHVGQLAEVMALTNRARLEALARGGDATEHLLDKNLLRQYRDSVSGQPFCSRGTTQLSVVDDLGNLASMTVSNGEGCGELVPGTGIMLNNMLGEEDINPGGFFTWPCNTRMTSMMAPSILHTSRGRAVLGSGGSNRLRTAILQVILNLVDQGMSIGEAVDAPRCHLESGVLNLEPGACAQETAALEREFGELCQWPEPNLYFGGVHSVWLDERGLQARGDARRDGKGVVVG